MPFIHDYKCKSCGKIVHNSFGEPDEACDCGHHEFEITFELWAGNTFNSMREFKSESDLVDDKGFRRRFLAQEDPICAIELGLQESRGIQTFSPEQQKHYAYKMFAEDSPKLRREILRERDKNLKAQGISGPEVM
jgi:hypothetical protein